MSLRDHYTRLLAHNSPHMHLLLDSLNLLPASLALPDQYLTPHTPNPPPNPLHPFNIPPLPPLPHSPRSQHPPPSHLSPAVLSSLLSAARPTLQPTQPRSPNPATSPHPPSSVRAVQSNPPQLHSTPRLPQTQSPAPHPPLPRPPPPQTHHPHPTNPFRTARSRLLPSKRLHNSHVKHAATHRHTPRSSDAQDGTAAAMAATAAVLGSHHGKRSRLNPSEPQPDVPDVPNVDPKLVEMIVREVLDLRVGVGWDDIVGLQFAKRCIMEAVIWPMRRPDIFQGLRGPPKGVLLFGPPGTGKTMIGRAIACQSGARFLNISASSLMSKWVGEGEKMVRALFGVARAFQPSVVFIDEIDSLLTQRTDGEQESTRRMKTEFLVQMDGAATSSEDRILVVGATNRPQELDEAARRRLIKRLYIPLPDFAARVCLVERLLQKQNHGLTTEEMEGVGRLTEGYSGSDVYAVCAEAALGPVRELGERIASVGVEEVRNVGLRDFEKAVRMVRASVSEGDLGGYIEWNERFGSFPGGEGDGESDAAKETEAAG